MNNHIVKQILLMSILLLWGLNSLSNERVRSFKTDKGFSSINQKELNQFYLKLLPIKHSTHNYHFKFEYEGQIVELYSQDGVSFSGTIINSIMRYRGIGLNHERNSRAVRYHYNRVEINRDTAGLIGRYVINQKLYSIPTDTLINGWELNWLDCNSIYYTYKLSDKIFHSEYVCHYVQNDSIESIRIIKESYDSINQLLRLSNVYIDFLSKLKKGKMYSSDGYAMTTMMTKRKSTKYKRTIKQREFLKSIKDSVDHFFETEIAKWDTLPDKFSCFENYLFTYNKKGKFRKVQVLKYEKPKISNGIGYYFEDRKDINCCKKLLKSKLERLNLNRFTPISNVSRTITFTHEGTPFLMDNTQYQYSPSNP